MVFQHSPAKTLDKWIGNICGDVGEHRLELAIKSSSVFVVSDQDVRTGLLTAQTSTRRRLGFDYVSPVHTIPKHSDMWKLFITYPLEYWLPFAILFWIQSSNLISVMRSCQLLSRFRCHNEGHLHTSVNKLTQHWGWCSGGLIFMSHYYADTMCSITLATATMIQQEKSTALMPLFNWQGINKQVSIG